MISNIEKRIKTLEDKSERVTESGCWIWAGSSSGKMGYGQLTVDNKKVLAHRLSYMIFVGEIPAGMNVCHKCDVPSCINPDHLFAGTQKDNLRDRDNKNRQARNRGERAGGVKLSEQQVLNIRADVRMQKDIAKDYNVSKSQISVIKRRTQWAHV